MVDAMAKRCLAAIALGLLSLAAASSASAAAAASSSSAEGGRRWAVIAVGSSGFRNYRHQADACHAYQLMVASGIPKAQIILMMQDDVAWASANPFPGELYNKPGWDSPNVYRDCHVDYRGSVVTADLFLKVITGDDSNLPSNGSGKVLRSSSSDQVFLNFVDHGGAGMVQFPNGPLLYAADLTQALETMQSKNMFKELVFYMEACHAGSMFQNLSKDGKIFAVAAANAHESSYATYCPPYDVAKGRHVGSCLGDLFSVAWMEDAERGVGRETVKDQVARATARTRSSHVSSFGDDSVQSLPMLGMRSSRPDGEPFRVQHVWAATAAAAEAEVEEAWDVRDIPLHTAYWQWSRASATDKIKQFSALEGIIAHRKADEELFANITREACHSAHIGCRDDMASLQMALQDVACHKALSTEVETECPRQKDGSSGWNGFSMKFSQVLVNICESRASLKKEIADLVLVVRSECRKEGQTQRGADAGSDDGARRLSPSPSLSLGTVLV